jgi:hypothetical protein
MVWWNLPAAYGVGEAANLVVGWVLVVLVLDRMLPRTSTLS